MIKSNCPKVTCIFINIWEVLIVSNFNKLFFLSALLLILGEYSLHCMEDKVKITAKDMQFFPQDSLFLQVYEGDKDSVQLTLKDPGQKERINIEINGGSLNGYTALRLAVNLWKGKVTGKRMSGHKKQAYKEIAQILVNNGADTRGIEKSLGKMGVAIPVQIDMAPQVAPAASTQGVPVQRDMVRQVTPAASAQSVPEFPDKLPLFKAVYEGGSEVVKMLLEGYGQKSNINTRIESEGKYRGYTALMLAIDLWKETENPTEKETYKNIAQILVDNGAEYMEAIGDDLTEMGVNLTGTRQTGARPRRAVRRQDTKRLHREQFPNVEDLSKLDEGPK